MKNILNVINSVILFNKNIIFLLKQNNIIYKKIFKSIIKKLLLKKIIR